MQKKNKYHHGNLKEELLKLSLNTILEDGVEVLTLKLLGDKLGTSRSAIYRHFSSKEDLIQNVLMYGFQLFEEALIPVLNKKEKSVEERLYLMGKAYINFALENPNLYKILFGENFQEVREAACTLKDHTIEDSFYLLVNLLEEGKEKHIFHIEDCFIQALSIHSLVHGMAILYVDGHSNIKDNISNIFDIALKSLLNGILIKK